jgi:hypothetical protein
VPGIPKIPPKGDFVDFKRLLIARDQAQDFAQSVLDIRANLDAFEGPPKESDLTKALTYTTSYIQTCNEKVDEVYSDPLTDIVVPAFDRPILPNQNPYSIDAVHSHLTRGYKITVTLSADIAKGTKEAVPLKAEKPYEIFIRGGNIWYCVPSSPQDQRPSDVTHTVAPAAGQLWLWGVMLRYDNRLEVVHTSGVKGRIAILL